MNDAKTIGSNALVLDTAEENVTVMNAEESKLGNEVSLIEQRAEAVVVASGADFEDAGLFLKQIKQAQKQVKDYWEPLRVSAKKSYDEVLTHRKEMIEPLEKAEKIVKTKVNEYSAEQERKRREQEEAMRRLAQAEIDRHLNEAAEAEANGDAVGAEYAMAEAEMMEGVSIAGGVQHQTPKVKGISQSKTWEICESECDWSTPTLTGASGGSFGSLRKSSLLRVLPRIRASPSSSRMMRVWWTRTTSRSIRSAPF